VSIVLRYGHKIAIALVAVVQITAAYGHSGDGIAGGFLSGFQHPLFGLDHLVAMVAVGLWGAFLGMPAIWILPMVFPLVMAMGGAIGIVGIPLPHVEVWVAVSAVVLGACVALALRPPFWVAAIIVGAFAIFHGHVHGTQLPDAADPLAYAIGFVTATGMLHLTGIGIGTLSRFSVGQYVIRGAGVAIAAVGLFFLLGYA